MAGAQLLLAHPEFQYKKPRFQRPGSLGSVVLRERAAGEGAQTAGECEGLAARDRGRARWVSLGAGGLGGQDDDVCLVY
eukprot:1819645-Rhodomonas_salina.1